jgi:hypothetical protein
MHAQRLTALAALLATVPPEKFDLEGWRMDKPGGNECWQEKLTDAMLLNPACGTCGCAVGWACAMPEFQQQGLVWEKTPAFGEERGWDAVSAFFDLSDDATQYLFSASHYEREHPTAADVVERITKLLKAEA